MHLFAFSSHSSPPIVPQMPAAVWIGCSLVMMHCVSPRISLYCTDILRCPFIAITTLKKKKQNYHDRKVSGYKRLGFRERVNCTGVQGNLERGLTEMFYILSVVVVTYLYLFVKTNQVILKLVDAIICKLFLDKDNKIQCRSYNTCHGKAFTIY